MTDSKMEKKTTVEVTWPIGQMDRLTNPSIDQIITMKEREGSGTIEPTTSPTKSTQ